MKTARRTLRKLLESVYEKCLKHELTKRGLHVETQVWLAVIYDGIEIEGGYKIDLLVAGQVVVELKVVGGFEF